MPFAYILHSDNIDKFYIGACHDNLKQRILNHNNASYGKSRFTANTADWKLFLSFEVQNYSHAICLERKIKAMKSRKYIFNLKRYPEMQERIIQETS